MTEITNSRGGLKNISPDPTLFAFMNGRLSTSSSGIFVMLADLMVGKTKLVKEESDMRFYSRRKRTSLSDPKTRGHK